MALPGVRQTFAVENARDMTEKLWWEIGAYQKETDLQPKLWRAFNCAVTAWHVSDWLWRERRDAGLFQGDVMKFQAMMQDRSRDLRFCKHIATASKHAGVRKPDLTIQVDVRAKDTPEQVPFAEIDHTQHWEIVISDSSGEYDALEVFFKAQEFWDAEIRDDERRSAAAQFNWEP
jgi:hypothetical protein